MLTVILLASVLTVTASAKSFTDMSGYSTEYLDAVNYVSDNNIMQGTTSTKFGPTTSITRAMAVTILYRMSGDSYTASSLPFTDVSSTDYYYNAVGWAVAKGIANGTTETKFAPNNAVTNEQFVTFLYRYAQYKNDSVAIINGTVSTNFCSDYSSISSYATTAFRWAIDRKIYKVKSSYVYPKSSTARIDAAYTIANYERKIVGIKFGRDNFSFTNSSQYFVSDVSNRYYISNSDLTKMINNIRAYYGNDTQQANNDIGEINDERQKTWSGSCYGMTSVVALDKIGKINFDNGYPCMNAITTPRINNTNFLSEINYYQLLQYVDALDTIIYYGDNRANGLQNLVIAAKLNSLISLGFRIRESNGNQFGHRVLLYDYKVVNGRHVISTCDPYNSANAQSISISSDYSDCIIRSGNKFYYSDEIINIRFISWYDIFDYFDYEDTNNYTSATVVTHKNDTKTDVNTYLKVSVNSDFIIENNEGQKLSFKAETFSFTGDMELINVYDAGNDFVKLEVYDSEAFKYKSLDGDSYFRLCGNVYSGAEGINISNITVCNDGSVSIEGHDDTTYCITTCISTDKSCLIKVIGKGSTVSTEINDNKVIADGLCGNIFITSVTDNEVLGQNTHLELANQFNKIEIFPDNNKLNINLSSAVIQYN